MSLHDEIDIKIIRKPPILLPGHFFLGKKREKMHPKDKNTPVDRVLVGWPIWPAYVCFF